jgi:hypothetical protein
MFADWRSEWKENQIQFEGKQIGCINKSLDDED